MPETLHDMSLEGGAEASNDALGAVIKELGISQEMEEMIRKIKGTKLEDCIISLEDIAKEVKEKHIGNADRDKRVRETLASEYGIIFKQWGANKVETTTSSEILNFREQNNINFLLLAERLEAVKSLDTTVVDEELKSAKASHPLPDNIRGNISKATGIAPESLDSVIQNGTNPQVNNLVDTYYITYSEKKIKSRLPNGESGEVERKFSDLRASARENGVLAPFPAKDLESRIADKPTKTQRLILSGAESITKGRPDTLVVREGEQLFFKSPDGKEVTHTMDISKMPPEVTQVRGTLRVTYILPDTVDQEKQAGYKKMLETSRKSAQGTSEDIFINHKYVEKPLRNVDQKVINIDELSSLVSSLTGPLATEKKKENCDRLIQLCSEAELSGAFDAKTELRGDELSTTEGFRDYFFGQKVRVTELLRKLDEIASVEKKIKSPKNEKTTDEYERNISQNLDRLSDIGLSQFSSMSEIYAFLQTQNGPEVGNNWGDAESINNSLGNNPIERSQLIKMLSNLAVIHDNIAGTKASELPNDAKISVLMRTEGNGIPRIINSLRGYKVTNNGGSEINASQFTNLLQKKSIPQPKPKKI